MKRQLLSALLSVPFFVLATGAAAQTFVIPTGTTNTYINNGTSAPLAPIEAETFINNGTFIASTLALPFETSGTEHFINQGTMSGNPGFYFNNSIPGNVVPPNFMPRSASASFFNGNNGLVHAERILKIWADDVVNRGILEAGSIGNVEIFSTNAMLSRSIVRASPISANPFGTNVVTILVGTNSATVFVPDLGLHDSYWGVSNFTANLPFNTAAIWNGAFASAPNVPVAPQFSPPSGFNISFSTNVFGTQTAGFAEANVNTLFPIPESGVLFIQYDFFGVPDTIDVFASSTNGTSTSIFSSGMTNGAGLLTINYGPGITNIVIIMNQGGNPNLGTAWIYTPTIISANASLSRVPAAWYSNVLTTTTVTITNIPSPMGPTNLVPIMGVFSNVVKGAVFAAIPPQFAFDIRFTPGFAGGNPVSNLQTIGVLLTLPVTNSATGVVENNDLYFEDTLGSWPGPRLMLNALDGTFRPTNYIRWSRQASPGGTSVTNGLPELNFFIDSGNSLRFTNDISSDVVSNTVVQSGLFSAYEMIVDSLAVRPPNIVGAGVSNFLGSVRIVTDTLDISHARLRAEGEIFIDTKVLISSTNAFLDAENLRFDIGAPLSGTLVVDHLANETVEGRIRGPVRAFSAVWSNTVQLVFPNNQTVGPDPNNPGDTNLVVLPSPLTNNAAVLYHVFMLDATGLQTIFPVNVFSLVMHGTNIIVNDNVTVYESFFADGLSLTLNGRLTFPGAMPVILGFPIAGSPVLNWINTNAPTLLFFTNNVSLSIPNEAHFGDDRSVPYSAFVTRGAITAGSLQVDSAYIEIDGRLPSDSPNTLQSSGIMVLEGGTMVFLAGQTLAGNFASLTATDLTFSNHTLLTGGALNLSVSGNLSDVGTTNVFQAADGVNLLVKPATGDLLNSIIVSTGPRPTGQFVSHLWAAENRGATTAGYQDNAAIGNLTLFGNADCLFAFAGTGANNGLYVDVLDLSFLPPNFTNMIQIDPNLVIYFASIILPPGFVLPPATSAEQFFDGRFGGHLRWVPSFAGPASSVSLDINGKSYKFNKALRESMSIDSDGDGVVNGLDNTPFRAPFTGPSAAKYAGLFYGTNGIEYLQSGAISIVSTKNGKYSGSLRTAAKKYSFNGRFDTNGADVVNVPKSTLTVELQAEQDHLSGTVSDGANWTAVISAERIPFGKGNKAPFAGTYNMIFPGSGDTNNTLVPPANGTGKAKVNTVGSINFKGQLGDGSKLSQTTSASQDGLWPLFVPLYKGKGQILGWQTFSGSNDVGGPFTWIKQPDANAKSYPAGFKVETNATGSKLP